jgi:HEPN domain-containing protein
VKRDDLQRLSRIRLAEANTLLRGGHFDGAYYLAGYAVECGLKAAIARGTRRHEFPDLDVVRDSYTHDVAKLVRVAGLQTDLEQLLRADRDFELNWSVVRAWNEESRYRLHAQAEALDLYSAITTRRSGVMAWIRRHW